MAKDINNSVFDESTRLKLDIFGQCFEEWLPVFNNIPFIESVYIFDFFAGSGKDLENNIGSPLILLDKARGKNRLYCINTKKEINFIFNDEIREKANELNQNIIQHIDQCKKENNCNECIYCYKVENLKFKEIFAKPDILKIFLDGNIGKFVLLDQYGFSQIDENIFKQLISFPKTDFIFFISSSFISRFREHPNTKKIFITSKINFDDIKPNEIHRAVANYFRDLIPIDKEYYLHHFTIQKENKGNYYGLIFGTNHTLGMEKFLKVCWQIDPYSGEANFNIDNNFEEGSLFENAGINKKKDLIRDEIKNLIISGEITDNNKGLKYAMQRGCEPKLFTEVVKDMEKIKLIVRIGDLNYQSTNIHSAKKYKIRVLKNGK